jgi:integrase
MRVPERYRSVELRGEIHRSLKTDSEREALARLPAVEAVVLAELDARLTVARGGTPGDVFSAAVALAATRGITYRPVQDLASGPLDEILARLDALRPSDAPEVAQAVLGAVQPPQLMLSELVAEVERISAHENRFKSENQMRLWRHPRERAVGNLIAALGEDRAVMSIGQAEALKHKAWWKRRIAMEGQTVETAGKDFSNMAGMLRRYYESIQVVDPAKPYAGVQIQDRHATTKRKLEIPADWVQEKWFAPGALDGLNSEARDILLISIETGCRQSEIHDLPPDGIVLDHPIPHLRIAFEEGEGKREVKNTASVRLVPLVGVALAAAKRHPEGFPRYRGKSNYSALINKFLRSNKLMPTPKHTVGGTRHAWESRLKAADVESDDRGEMMGHDVASVRNRERYGDEMPLPDKLGFAMKVVLPVPAHLM